MATLITKNSSTASAVPAAGDLVKGELAVNVTDKKVYTKDNSAAVVKLVGSLGNQEANAVAITGGAINGTTIGATTPSTGAFTTASASGGFTGNLTGNVTGNVSGTAANVTGVVAIANGGTGLSSLGTGVQSALGQAVTGSGSFVLSTSPSLTTPNLGTPSAAVLTNATGLPLTTGVTGTLGVANGGTGITAFGTGVATALGQNVTGSGGIVLATSPSLTTPNLGTPSAATLTNATGLPISTGVSGLGTNVATALAVNVGTAGAFVVNGGALGTPSSGTVTNLTGTASININGTVGATTPTTGAFTTLSASGNITVSGGTANGVAYLNGSKVLTTGSALTFDGTTLTNTRNTTDGSAASLTLNNSGASASYATLNLNAGSVTYQQFADAAGNAIGTAGVMFRTTSNHPLVWGINSTEGMRLTSTGLGIGTSSPSAKLTVFSGADGDVGFFRGGSTRQVQIGTSSTAGYINTDNGSAGLEIRTQGTARMYVDNAGNLGLGVTPSAVSGRVFEIGAVGHGLAYRGAADINLTQNAYWLSGSWRYGATTGVGASAYQQIDGSHRWQIAPSGTAGNAISFTQALTLHASGGMSLGNTSDPGATNLSVTGTITSGKGANVASASTVTLGAGNFFDITGTTTISNITIKPAGTVVYLKFDSSLTLQTGSIGSSGAMRLTNGASLGVSQYDVLTLISDGTNWWQVAYNNN